LKALFQCFRCLLWRIFQIKDFADNLRFIIPRNLPHGFQEWSVMRIVIFGTGAMACLFGARLAAAAEVALVGTWTEGIEAVRKRGIMIEDSRATRTAPVSAGFLGSSIEPADVAIVLVKSWQSDLIAQHLPRYLKTGSPAISLQNGLGNLERLGNRVLPGTTAEGATLLGPGRVRSGGSGPTHIVGPDWVTELFISAGFETYRCDLPQATAMLWGKLSVSCGINALTALLRVPNGELLNLPGAADLMTRAACECADVARAAGIDLPFTDPAAKVREVAARTAANRSSMLQDILRGTPTECDAINGAVVREGARLGIATPVNEVLWQLVRAAAHQNRSNAGP
jgi:2-dehydropantoate 2-reductase